MENPIIKTIKENNEVRVFLPLDMDVKQYAICLEALGRMTDGEAINTFGSISLIRAMVKSFGKEKLLSMVEWNSIFELGTPVAFQHNGREVTGEVVNNSGKKVVSLYKDDNYSGDEERIVVPEWDTVKNF